jgi:F-type H+-transporting ATPase subunit delta
MKSDAAARRYARALFDLAEREGALDTVGAALAATAELLDDPRVARVLTGPVEQTSKQDLLRTIAAKAGAPPVFRDLLLLLAERGRLPHLAAIRSVFDQLVDRRLGRARATVRSAAPLSPDAIAELARVFGRITGKQVLAQVTVDHDLVAGMIVEIEGKVYDGSLRTQLARLRQQMAIAS